MIATQHLPRILTGLTLLALLTLVLTLGKIPFLLFIMTFAGLGLWEFYRMFWSGTTEVCGRVLGLVCGLALLYVASWQHPQSVTATLSLVTLMFACVFLVRWSLDHSYSPVRPAILLLGILYVPMLIAPVYSLTTVEIVCLLLAAGASDTIAYFVGMRFGRHKIWPAVSPKKSVEGSLAGLIACIVVTSLMGLAYGMADAATFALLGLTLGVTAQLGDFFESALKRARNVKDSGVILPGHGGVLDRADSLLFLIPVYAAVKSFMPFF